MFLMNDGSGYLFYKSYALYKRMVGYLMARKRSERTSVKRDVKGAVQKTFDIPIEALSNISQLEILSNKEAIIEGCKGILEYDDTLIRISTNKMEIKFLGENLTLRCLTSENIVVEGKIFSVEFIT
jgi:sporulation protein YqfC